MLWFPAGAGLRRLLGMWRLIAALGARDGCRRVWARARVWVAKGQVIHTYPYISIHLVVALPLCSPLGRGSGLAERRPDPGQVPESFGEADDRLEHLPFCSAWPALRGWAFLWIAPLFFFLLGADMESRTRLYKGAVLLYAAVRAHNSARAGRNQGGSAICVCAALRAAILRFACLRRFLELRPPRCARGLVSSHR